LKRRPLVYAAIGAACVIDIVSKDTSAGGFSPCSITALQSGVWR
jgi:hypothetical protein